MKSVLIGIAVVGMCTGIVSAKNLDTFDVGPFFLPVNGGPNPNSVSQSPLPTTDVLGGQRDTTLTRNEAQGNCSASVTTGIDTLEWSNGTGVTSMLEVEYGVAGPMGEDLTADGGMAFWFIASTDGLNHPMDISLEVTSGINEGTPVTATVTEANFATVNESAFTPVSMPFASFGAVNMGDVDYVKMTLSSQTTAVDGNIDLFTTTNPVPEPMTMSLLGLAGMGLIGYIRKRRTA